jgi:hypothetical protein
MTVTLDRPAPAARRGVRWRSPEPGLWVADGGADYRGMVELRGDVFVASGADSRHLGVFHTMDQAKRAIDPDTAGGIRDDADARADLVGMLIAAATGALALTAAIAGMLDLFA